MNWGFGIGKIHFKRIFLFLQQSLNIPYKVDNKIKYIIQKILFYLLKPYFPIKGTNAQPPFEI